MEKTITKDRVRKNTPWGQNVKIDNLTRQNIGKYYQGSNEEISQRLRNLDKKWDIERTLELNMSTVALTSLALSVFENRRWAFLTGAVLGFFM